MTLLRTIRRRERTRSPGEAGRRRHILYLITSDISARFLSGQLGFLIEHGFDVSVGTRLSDPPADFDPGVAVHDLPFEREPSATADLRALWATARLIGRVRPDIVNASTPKAGLLGMLAARVCRVPQRVYVVRGLRFETTTGFRRHVYRFVERLAASCATDVIYNSRSLLVVGERERAVARGKGAVLGAGSGNGIDVDRFRDLPSRPECRRALGLDPEARVIGFVGRLTRDKGIVDLVEAFRELPDAVLLLVGDFEPGDPVPDNTRREIEANDRIHHVGWVGDSRTIYPAMDVLAFPSYREGLPNVPLEAQLCGVPVVAYGATGTVDAVAPISGALVPLADRERLQASILAVLGGVAGSGADAREWTAHNFDASQVWSMLLDSYGRIRQ